jgi:DNA-directed RNA polymerase subunit RPC12/RpoP
VLIRGWTIEIKTEDGKCQHCGQKIWGEGLP